MKKEKVIAAIISTAILLVVSVIHGILVLGAGEFMRSYGSFGWAWAFEIGNAISISIAWAFFTKQLLEVLVEEDDES